MVSKYLLTGAGFFGSIINELFFWLSSASYGLSKTSYDTFCDLSQVSLTGDKITSLMERLNLIIGLIMVFVVSYNLLAGIVDPDKELIKKVNSNKLIQNVIIALVITLVQPLVFTKLYGIQAIVIDEGIISNLISGGISEKKTTVATKIGSISNLLIKVMDGEADEQSNLGRQYIKEGGNKMIANVFGAFITPKDDNFSYLDCQFNENTENYNDLNLKYNDYCKAYSEVYNTGNISAFKPVANKEGYEFNGLIAFAGGLVLTFFMAGFNVSLGTRVGKMTALQWLGPISSSMEIIPGKEGTRNKWATTLGKVYSESFSFQTIVHVVMYLTTLVPTVISELFYSAVGGTKIFLIVFLIIGLMQFGKSAPGLIADLLGINVSGGAIADAAKNAVNYAGASASGIASGIGNIGSNIAQGYKGARLDANGQVKMNTKTKKPIATRRQAVAAGLKNAASNLGFSLTSAARGFKNNTGGGFKGIKQGVSNAIHQTEMDKKNLIDRKEKFNTASTVGEKAKAIFGGGQAARNAASQKASLLREGAKLHQNVKKGKPVYEAATSAFNETKRNNAGYVSAYNDWANMKRAKNVAEKDITEKNFIKDLSSKNGIYVDSNGRTRMGFDDILNAYDRQQNAEKEVYSNKKVQAQIGSDALAQLNHIELNLQGSLSEETQADYNELRQMIDKDGNVQIDRKTGKLYDYKTIDEKATSLSTKMEIDAINAERVLRRQQQIEEARKRGNGNQGGGK